VSPHLSSAPTYRRPDLPLCPTRPDLPLCPTRLFDPRSGHDDLAHAGPRTNFESLCFTQLSPLVQQLVTCRRQPPVADTKLGKLHTRLHSADHQRALKTLRYVGASSIQQQHLKSIIAPNAPE
jgi:hypothetical protein